MIKDSKILGPPQIPSDKELQEIMDEIFMKIETKPEPESEPKYKIGDIVYLCFCDRPMKIIGRCYDEHWRYKIEGLEDNEYWYYEKDFKNMKE